MADIEDSHERLDGLLAQMDRRIAAAFRKAISQLRADTDLEIIALLIESGQAETALGQLNFAAAATAEAYHGAFIASAQSTADYLRNSGVMGAFFDAFNTFAVAAMQANRLSLIREFSQQQRDAVQIALVNGARRGDNPRTQARNFRDSIGLTAHQQQAVDSYRGALTAIGRDGNSASDVLGRALRDKRGDASVMRAVRAAEPIPQARLDWMVTRYTERYVKYRAETIGRTEALSAVHQGTQEMYRQAIADDQFAQADVTRQWHTNLDGRERQSHFILHGQKRGFDEPWKSISGATLNYPGDPEAPAGERIQCRCTLTYLVAQA